MVSHKIGNRNSFHAPVTVGLAVIPLHDSRCSSSYLVGHADLHRQNLLTSRLIGRRGGANLKREV